MQQPRFRMFAGPNGSGKTDLFQHLKKSIYIHTEIYLNADRIEKELKEHLHFNFNAYRISVSETEIKEFIRKSGLFKKANGKKLLNKISLKSGLLKLRMNKSGVDSYLASFISSFLAEKLLETKQSFCFETVMSHHSKIELLKKANERGYKTYLYFVFTDNYRLNEARIKLRVKQGGHDVSTKKIKSRYFRSFKLLRAALKYSSKAYIIDNSEKFKIIAEQHNWKLHKTTGNIPKVIKMYL